MNDQNFLSIKETARKLGVSEVTLRRWDKSGFLKSAYRTEGNHRRYALNDILNLIDGKKKE